MNNEERTDFILSAIQETGDLSISPYKLMSITMACINMLPKEDIDRVIGYAQNVIATFPALEQPHDTDNKYPLSQLVLG